MQRQMEALEAVLSAWEELGRKERLLVFLFTNRLLAGQRQFGKLTTGKKRWTKEALEESIDETVYMSAQYLDHLESGAD